MVGKKKDKKKLQKKITGERTKMAQTKKLNKSVSKPKIKVAPITPDSSGVRKKLKKKLASAPKKSKAINSENKDRKKKIKSHDKWAADEKKFQDKQTEIRGDRYSSAGGSRKDRSSSVSKKKYVVPENQKTPGKKKNVPRYKTYKEEAAIKKRRADANKALKDRKARGAAQMKANKAEKEKKDRIKAEKKADRRSRGRFVRSESYTGQHGG